MRTTWEALHRSLVRSTESLNAHRIFEEIKESKPDLARFDAPTSLLDLLHGEDGDLDEKDLVLRALVELAQGRGEAADLARDLLWLGLWPGLDAIYRRHLRHFRDRPEELVSEVGARFTDAVARVDLGRIRRVAATLVRNTEREVRAGEKRAWDAAARRSELPEGDELADGDHLSHARLPRRPTGVSDLGLPPGMDPEDQLAAIRAFVAEVVGDDADLVIGAAVYGVSQRELAERLGLTHEAARKRFQRALARLRRHVEGER